MLRPLLLALFLLLPIASHADNSVIVVKPGDTLGELLATADIPATDIAGATAALAPILPPQRLRPGHEIALTLENSETETRLQGLEIEIDPLTTATVTRGADGQFTAARQVRSTLRHLVRGDGLIRTSLYEQLAEAGVPPAQILGLIRALGQFLDLQRDVQPGDRFAVMWERFRGEDGSVLLHGAAVYAEFVFSGKRIEMWRHTLADGSTEWLDTAGRPLRRALLRTPLDGARVSSGFGMRRHPILGYSRKHQGIDFAAPTGTPVYAAADGRVRSAGWKGGYGRTVDLVHNGNMATRYAHMSRIARGLRPGSRVRQGQVIGHVGSTGRSTGPHLHFEVHVAGTAVNPARRRDMPPPQLPATEVAAFQRNKARLHSVFAALAGSGEVAAAEVASR